LEVQNLRQMLTSESKFESEICMLWSNGQRAFLEFKKYLGGASM